MKWFEDERNFPAIMVNDRGEFTIAKNKEIYFLNVEYNFRLATRKESEKLFVKDK